MKLVEIAGTRFITPNFDKEWEEIEYDPESYSQYFPTKKIWEEVAKSGHVVTLSNNSIIDNSEHDDKAAQLDKTKIDRVDKLFKSNSQIELPIVMQVNNKYRLIAGNTRLRYMAMNDIPLHVWLIKL